MKLFCVNCVGLFLLLVFIFHQHLVMCLGFVSLFSLLHACTRLAQLVSCLIRLSCKNEWKVVILVLA